VTDAVASLASRLATLAQRVDQVAVQAPAAATIRLGLGAHGGADWERHRVGLGYLTRELGASGAGRLQDLGQLDLGTDLDVDVVYMAGSSSFSLAEPEVNALARLLERGGTIIGEGCASGANADAGAVKFAESFFALAVRLGRQPTRIGRAHPLMTARYVFADPPPGMRQSPAVREANGMVYSDADYGCTWQGGPDDRSLPRSAIRDALEFGVNMAIYRRGAHGAN
jgi:hypothetical protein